MNPEFVKTINKALALVAIACGGFGMMLCVPFLLSSNLVIITSTAIVFLAGAVLYGAGATSMAILVKDAT